MSDREPANSLRERVGGRVRGLWLWVLLDAGRLRLTAALCAGFFVVVLAASALARPSLRSTMLSGGDPVDSLYQAYVTALVTGVTLVVTLSQVVLSQEAGPLGDQRQRVEGALAFREDAEKFFESVSPPQPSSFLAALVEESRDRAVVVRERLGDDADDDLLDFLDDLTGHADEVGEQLHEEEFGNYAVVRAAIDFDYTWKIYRARRLGDEHVDDLSEEAADALDDLVEVLEFFGPAREHVKALFFEWELVALSRRILYLAVPALAVAVLVLLFLEPGSTPDRWLGVSAVGWTVAATSTVAVSPFLLLAAYVVRLATVARRTLSVGPFILRESERVEELDWEE